MIGAPFSRVVLQHLFPTALASRPACVHWSDGEWRQSGHGNVWCCYCLCHFVSRSMQTLLLLWSCNSGKNVSHLYLLYGTYCNTAHRHDIPCTEKRYPFQVVDLSAEVQLHGAAAAGSSQAKLVSLKLCALTSS